MTHLERKRRLRRKARTRWGQPVDHLTYRALVILNRLRERPMSAQDFGKLPGCGHKTTRELCPFFGFEVPRWARGRRVV
jgi:hypothetical protein